MRGIFQLVVVLAVLAIALFPTNVLAKDSYEPNNSFATAYKMTMSGTTGGYVTSYLSTSTDVDYYKFTASSIAYIMVISPSGKKYDAYLYDKDYNFLGSSLESNILDFFQQETVCGETYYIKVVSQDGSYDAKNTYTLYALYTLPPL